MNTGQAIGGSANTLKDNEPSLLDQLAGELEAHTSRLHHAVGRTQDNTDRLLGSQPPRPTEAKTDGHMSLQLAIDRIKNVSVKIDSLAEELHDTNNRLSRL